MNTKQEVKNIEMTHLQVHLSIKLPTEDEAFIAELENLCRKYAINKDYFFKFE